MVVEEKRVSLLIDFDANSVNKGSKESMTMIQLQVSIL